MSAIYGVYYRQGKTVSSEMLQKMERGLIHRGVNGTKVWKEDCIGLGQLNGTTRQPFESYVSTISIPHIKVVIDGRIDNKEELISAMKLQKYDHSDIQDEDLIIMAYLKWGKNCTQRIKGVFVFALWNKKTHSLIISNDHLGLRNIYYYMDDEVFIFASEISSIRSTGLINIEHNTDKISSFILGHNYKDYSEDTYYKNISFLKRSSVVEVQKSCFNLHNYWNLRSNASKINYSNEVDYVEDFKEKFKASIKSRMHDQQNISIALSGGLDSSSITCVSDLLKENDQQIYTYHINSKHKNSNESSFSNAVVQACKTRHKDLSAFATFKSAYDCSKWLHQPMQAMHMGVMYAVWMTMSKSNQNVILSGEDGDYVVNDGHHYPMQLLSSQGYNTYRQSIFQRFSNRYFENFKDSFKDKSGYLKYSNNQILFDYLRNSLENKQYHKFLKMSARVLWQDPTLSAKPIIKSLYHEYINSSRIIEKDQYQKPFFENILIPHNKFENKNRKTIYSDTVQEDHIHHIKNTPVYYYADSRHISERLNIDIRYPFMDRDLIELCVASPDKMKWYHGVGRGLLRKAMNGILPEKVRNRKSKSDFTQHIIENFRNNEIEFYKDTYLNLNTNIYYNESYLKSILKDFENKELPYYALHSKFNTLRKHAYLSNWLIHNK